MNGQQDAVVLAINDGEPVEMAKRAAASNKFWHIGIRIEDDALVTPDGCELISRGVPVRADEIEALMRAG